MDFKERKSSSIDLVRIEEVNAWKEKYPISLAELTWLFQPKCLPPHHSLPKEYPSENRLLNLVGFSEPIKIARSSISYGLEFSGGSAKRTNRQTEPGFVDFVNQGFGREIAEAAEFQKTVLEGVCTSYPLKGVFEEISQEIITTISELQTRKLSSVDSMLKASIVEQETVNRTGMRKEEIRKGTNEERYFYGTYQRLMENIDAPSNRAAEYDEALRQVLVDRIDGCIGELVKSICITQMRMSNEDFYFVPESHLKIHDGMPGTPFTIKNKPFAPKIIGYKNISEAQVEIGFGKREYTSYAQHYEHCSIENRSLPSFRFVDKKGRKYVLFSGKFDDFKDWGGGSGGYQLNIGHNRAGITEGQLLLLGFDQGVIVPHYYDEGFDTNNFSRITHAAMSVKLVELLSIHRDIISSGAVPNTLTIDLKKLADTGLMSLFDQDRLTQYDGTVESLHQIVFFTMLKNGAASYILRDDRIRKLRGISTYDLMGIHNERDYQSYDPNSPVKLKSDSDVGARNMTRKEVGELEKIHDFTIIAQGNVELPYYVEFAREKGLNLSGAEEVLFDDSVENGNVEFIGISPITPENGIVRIPMIQGAEPVRVVVSTKYEDLEQGTDYRIVKSDGDYHIVLDQNHRYGNFGLSVEFVKPNNESSGSESVLVNDNENKRNNLQELVGLFRKRTEVAYNLIADDLEGLLRTSATVADVVTVLRNHSEYSYNGTDGLYPAEDVLHHLSVFIDEDKLYYQCNGAEKLLGLCLRTIFRGEDVQIEKSVGYAMDTPNLGNYARSVMVHRSNRHALVRLSVDNKKIFCDATPGGDSSEEFDAQFLAKAPLFSDDVNNSRIALQHQKVKQLFNKIAPKNYHRGPEPGLRHLAELPDGDPVRSLVSLQLKYLNTSIDPKEYLDGLIDIKSKFSISELGVRELYKHQFYRKFKWSGSVPLALEMILKEALSSV